ncbi:hypothetical protein L1987_22111 [Smallanthus sonchifolius]|uniref:Uncharacterized protein n=1 Tax=Smallanthus sonchifolius TaxID=185202 RepID=A0ACB9ID83_9ASTR|nr:hypothetical protein L1987_22111 [Smallanthus sonchifolius]
MEEVVSSLTGKEVDSLFGVAKREISQMWNCIEIIEELKNEAKNLTLMKRRLQQRIDLAKSRGEVLVEGMEEWVAKANNKISDATEFIDEEVEAKKTCLELTIVCYFGHPLSLWYVNPRVEAGRETQVSKPLPSSWCCRRKEVTSNGNDKFLVYSREGLSEWQPRNDLESYKKISLKENKILLDMPNNNISSLPRSLKQLIELRTLDLSVNKSLRKVSILGELTCLEILKLRRTGIRKIPEELYVELSKLRWLDVYNC